MQLPSDPPTRRGWLAAIERAGNRLPHPFWLFAMLAALVALGSAAAAAAGAEATTPAGHVVVRSLLSATGLDYMLSSMVANFIGFPPLGLVLVLMFGVGLAQRSGLLDALMRRLVLGAAPHTVTAVVAVTGLMGNLASDSAAIVLPTLAAGAFAATGRHPLAGLALAWCCVLGGFSANLLIAGTDVILADITTRAARSVDPAAYVSPAANWYFMSASTLLLAGVAIWVTRRYVEPRLGPWSGAPDEGLSAPDPCERRALRRTGLAAFGFVALAVLIVQLPSGTGGPAHALTRLAVLLPLFFGVVGYVYGRSTGRIRGAAQVPALLAEALRELAPFLVMVFAAAQAIAWFGWAHLDVWLAERGAGLLQQRALDGAPGLLLFALVAGLAALFIGSASALWTLLAPVCVPMFMLRGIDPAYVQAAFRVTDSATNTLMPLGPLVPVMLGFLQKYDPRAGVGTLLALTLPYTLAFLLAWLALLALWAGCGWPVGPGHGLYRIG